MAFCLFSIDKTSTTGLVKSITQPGGNFTYDYDDNGNITSVVQDGVTTSYAYDALGQLIRVDDEQEGATWLYTYDQGGNILSKKCYAYTEPKYEIANPDSPLDEMTFGYVHEETAGVELDAKQKSENKWGDLLKYVNGKRIRYDEIGNPTQVGEDDDTDKVTFIWEKGRQLKRMVKSGETVEFKYNESGLRIQKVLNPDTANEEVTNYTLHGKNIVHMTKDKGNQHDSLHFFYDASNKPAIVVYNDKKYAYVHNLQGDIVAILDSAGNKVVQYAYDAWGRPIKKEGSLASTLGTVQPFRYRGYVYDEETGLYYLRSRFYSSVWCRFINADCILADTNIFDYCANNPVTYSDTCGMESQPVLRQYRSLASQIETQGYAIRINPEEIINSQKVQTSFSVYIRYTAPEAQELAAELYWSETNLTSWRKTKPWIGVTSKVEDLLFDKFEVPLVSDIRDMVMHFADKEDAQNETAFRKQFQEKYYLAKRNDSAVILEFTFYSTTWQEMNMNMKNGVIYRQMNWHTVEAHEMLEFANSREGKR